MSHALTPAQAGALIVHVDPIRGARIRPSAAQLAALTEWGSHHEVRQRFGIEPQSHSHSKAVYLAAFRNADSLRARMDAAGHGEDLLGSRSGEEPRFSLPDEEVAPDSQGRDEAPQATQAEIDALGQAIDRWHGDPATQSPPRSHRPGRPPPGIRRVAEAFPGRAVGFIASHDAEARPEGAFWRGPIYLRVGGRKSHLKILGHELTHQRPRRDPEGHRDPSRCGRGRARQASAEKPTPRVRCQTITEGSDDRQTMLRGDGPIPVQ